MTSIKPMLINEEPIMFEGEHLQFYFTQYANNHLPCIICDSLESGPFATVTVNLDMNERFANSMYDAIDIAFSHNITEWDEDFTEGFTKFCKDLLIDGPTWPIKYGYATSIAGKLKASIILKFFEQCKVCD